MDLQRLMWAEIKQRLAKQERAEVKRLLGRNIIRKNSSLLREAVALQDMLRQFQKDNEEKLRKMSSARKFMSLSTPIQMSLKKQIASLVEKLRKQDMLEGNKRSFVDSVKKRTGVTGESIVSYFKKERKKGSPGGHISSSRSNQSVTRRRRPAGIVERPVTPSSRVIDSLDKNKTDLKRIETISHLLREGLEEETRSLEAWIAELTTELESEAAYVEDAREAFHSCGTEMPTASDLRKFKKKLESEWITRDSAPPARDEISRSPFGLGTETRAPAGRDGRSVSSSVPEPTSSRGRGGRSDSKMRSRLERLVLEARYLS
eukprot:g4022.t1